MITAAAIFLGILAIGLAEDHGGAAAVCGLAAALIVVLAYGGFAACGLPAMTLTVDTLLQAAAKLAEVDLPRFEPPVGAWGRPSSLASGFEIVEWPHLTERVMHARSPSRAKRRARQGHPQHHIVVPQQQGFLLDGRILVMHPSIARQLREATVPA